MDVTLLLFEEKGFHGTLVDDIASSVGISRAALYQYFGSKEEIFVELLRECGAALLRVIPRLGRTGPTPAGYDNLHWWLGEWAWVYDKYSTMFVQWSHVDSPRAPLRPLIADFNSEYTRRMTDRLAECHVTGLDLEDLAAALLATVTRVNYYRTVAATGGVGDGPLLDALATVFQLVMYPSTPASALVHTGGPSEQPALRSPRPRRGGRPVSRRRAITERGSAGRLEGCSPQVRATVGRLLDAGAETLAANGYHLTSVDDIVRQAGLGRGTFYKYFSDKTDLLGVLAEDGALALSRGLREFDASAAGGLTGEDLRSWLRQFVILRRRYMGVFRAWSEGEPDVDTVQVPGRIARTVLVDAFARVLTGAERRHPLDVKAGSLIVLSLLEQLPGQVADALGGMSDERLVETMAVVIERGLLGRGRRGARPRKAQTASGTDAGSARADRCRPEQL
ncbi:TetR/AcrR family transcriptional regulator; helix-turn-helix transcriptional regulator [Acidiferrimicrobium sp. IK]|uniref:TetR/AcrR family transcriptional regulator n=1 Tax=Acidiferrimicrobium sp. IK TaxID=2871700 RepID=UPI0021CAF94E|nr:TetR/AcrR family transcriptional regulator [Acidiferrimicrobium sp. IK]MCU4183454.1 TetR/AcrR family transcriptional regulator; helix-turn-helix transcriptional regulator [Acidiferrimicrobium sp. IK]